MSLILPGSPEPGLEGEDKEYIKFAENMTPEKTSLLADKLVKFYMERSKSESEDV